MPSPARLLALGAVALAAALGLLSATPELALFQAAVPFFGWPAMTPGTFVEVPGTAGALWKLDAPWYISPFHMETLDIYAFRLGGPSRPGRWAVTDAGGYDTPLQRHASGLLDSLRRLLDEQSGTLSLVLLSHGHLDHVGALPQLLNVWPSATVVAHEAEAPYLLDNKPYSPPWLTSGSPGLRLAHLLGFLPRYQNVAPKERTVLLQGAKGELSSLGAQGVHWFHLPGHAPGHVVYLLEKSKVLLAGDIADLLLAPLPGGVTALPDGRALQDGQLYLFTMTGMDAADGALAGRSLCRLAFELQGWDRVLPYHDATKAGLDRETIQRLVLEAVTCPEVIAPEPEEEVAAESATEPELETL
jgi:glyoxylase-like metal-dependent hydrolase (beta-lactamase superfamily II)